MKAAYKILGQSGWITLFDQSLGASNLMPTFNPNFKFLTSTTPGFGAASQSIIPQLNVVVTLSLTFQTIYKTLGIALASIRQMRTVAGNRIHLMIVQDSETQYYPNGTVESYEPNITGANVDHKFVFRTQDLTTVKPTT